MRSSRSFPALALLLGCLGFGLADLSVAEEPLRDPKSHDIPPLVEIHCIPYDDFDPAVLTGRSMMLPYRELIELIGAAREADPGPGPGSFLRKAGYRGSVSGGVARISGELTVQTAGRSWNLILLRLGGGLARRIAVDGAPHPLISPRPHELIFPVRGPGEHQVTLDLDHPVGTRREARVLTLDLPRAAATEVLIDLPPGARVLADASSPGVRTAAGDLEDEARSTVRGSLPSSGPVIFAYREEETPGAAIRACEVTTRCDLTLEEGLARNRSELRIVAPSRPSLALLLPSGVEIARFASEEMARGRESREGDNRRIELAWTKRGEGPATLLLELESPLPPLPSRAELPLVTVEGATRHTGSLLVSVGAGLRLRRDEIRGLRRSGARPPGPGEATSSDLILSYELVRQPFGLTASLARKQPTADATVDAHILVDAGRITTTARLRLRPDLSSLHEARIPLPWTAGIQEVRPGVEGLSVRWTREGGSPASFLHLHFEPPLAPAISGEPSDRPVPDLPAVIVELVQPVDRLPSLAELRVPYPIEARTVRGTVEVATSPGMRVLPESSRGVTRIRPPAPEERPDTDLAFRVEDAPAGVTTRIEELRPRISARLLVLHLPSPQALVTRADLTYRVDHGFEDTFEFRLPPGYAEVVDVTVLSPPSVAIKEKRSSPDHETWTVSLQEKIRGEVRFRIGFERTLPRSSDEPTSEVELDPTLHASRVLTEESNIAVAAGRNVEIEVRPAGLREIDLLEMSFPEGIPALPLLHAFRSTVSDSKLLVKIRTHRPGPVTPCLVQSALHAVSLSEDGAARTQWNLQVKNAGRQHLEITLPPGSVHWSTLVLGRPIKALDSGPGSLLVPVPVSSRPDASFPVQITYARTLPGLGGSGSLEVSYPTVDVPVLVSRSIVDFPGEFELTGIDGTLDSDRAVTTAAVRPALSWLLARLGEASRGLAPTEESSAPAVPRSESEPALDDTVADQLRSLGYEAGGGETRKREKPRREAREGDPAAVADEKERDAVPADSPVPGEPPRKAGILPMTLTLRQGGRILALQGQGDGGFTRIGYVRTERLRTRELLFFLFGAALSWTLWTRRWLGLPGQILLVWPLLIFGPYLLGGALSRPLNAMLVGAGLVAGFGLIRSILLRVRTRYYLHRQQDLERWSSTLPVLLVGVFLLGPPASASPDPGDQPPSSPSAPSASIAIPYDPARGFPTADSTSPAFLPLEFYEALVRKARPESVIGPVPPGFAPAIVTGCDLHGQATPDGLELDVTLEVFSFGGGAFRLPLGFPEAVVREATVGGVPGPIFRAGDGDDLVVVLSAPGSHAVRLDLEVPFEKNTGTRRAGLTLPGSPAGSLRLRVPRTVGDLVVLPPPQTLRRVADGEAVIFEAAIPGAERLEFRAAPPEPARTDGLPYHLLADGKISSDAISVRSTFALEASPPSDSVAFELPETFQLTAVSGPRVLADSTTEEGGRTLLTVRLDPIRAGEDEITVAGFVLHDGGAVELPRVSLREGVLREGRLILESGTRTSFRLEATRGLTRARTETATRDRRRPVVPPVSRLEFNIVEAGYSGRVRFEPDRADLEVTLDETLDASSVRRELDVRITLRARRLGSLHEFEIPRGYSLLTARGSLLLDSWVEDDSLWIRTRVDGDRTETSLQVRLQAPAAGFPGDEPLPLLIPRRAQEVQGRIRIRTTPGVDVAVHDAVNLVDDPAAAGDDPDRVLRRTLAFREHPAATLRWAQVPAVLAATCRTRATFGEGTLDVDTGIDYRFEQGQSNRLFVSVPASIADLVAIHGKDVATTRPISTAGDRTLIGVDLHARQHRRCRVEVSVRLGWKASSPGEDPAELPVPVPCFRAERVARSSEEVVVSRETREELEVVQVDGLTRDPARTTEQQTTFRRTGPDDRPWSLAVRGTRTRAAEVLEAIINSMSLTSFALDTLGRGGGSLLTEMDLSLENRSEQYLHVRLPSGAELWSAFLDGSPTKPVDPTDGNGSSGASRAGAPDLLWIPLRKSSPGETASRVRLVYAQHYGRPLHDLGRFDPGAPEILNIPVSQTYWKILLPEGRTVEVDGNLDEIAEAVALVDRLESLVKQQVALEEVARAGTEAQRELARQNLGRNFMEIQKSRREAEEAQQRLLGDSQRQVREGDKRAERFRSQALSNTARLGRLEAQIAQIDSERTTPDPETRRALEALEDRDRGDRARALQKQIAAGKPSLARPGGATGTGLLSLLVELPPAASQVLFKKLEGDPRLTLAIEYHEGAGTPWPGVLVFLLWVGLIAAVVRIRALDSGARPGGIRDGATS